MRIGYLVGRRILPSFLTLIASSFNAIIIRKISEILIIIISPSSAIISFYIVILSSIFYHHPARRWVVERTNSWHNNRFRKLLVRYEKKSKNYLELVQLACCMILYKDIFGIGSKLKKVNGIHSKFKIHSTLPLVAGCLKKIRYLFYYIFSNFILVFWKIITNLSNIKFFKN